jgi:predicted nucleic acid-binding protein
LSPVFLDTVGLIAIWDRDDQWHEAASQAFGRLLSARTPVVTTTFVLAECGNAAARTTFRRDVFDLRESLESGGRVIVPTDADWLKAWENYQRGEAGQAGLVDHLSFVVMRRSGLTDAFTNDRHFAAAGFHILF